VRMSEPILSKRQTGKGEKPDDCWALPLCHRHHETQHLKGEKIFWDAHDINPVVACLILRIAYEHEDRKDAERFIETINNFAMGRQQ
jgi:hypothetical protein